MGGMSIAVGSVPTSLTVGMFRANSCSVVANYQRVLDNLLFGNVAKQI